MSIRLQITGIIIPVMLPNQDFAHNLQFQEKLIAHIEDAFQVDVTSIQTPPQGMSSSVFFVRSSNGTDYAVKYGDCAQHDVPALELISREHVAIPIPKLLGSFLFEEVPVVLMERIQFPLLETVPRAEMSNYIPSMIQNLRALHSIHSISPGPLGTENDKKSWKEIMLDIFVGNEFGWVEIAHRKGLDTELVTASVEKIVRRIRETEFITHEYSLLHTDFNQRNLFVDPQKHEIAGIIDWEEAVFGDPIYDFARVRLFMLHFNFDEYTAKQYYDLVQFTPEQKKLEQLYVLSYMIQYLAWYSEELNEFNVGRIKLHQDYLRAYNW